MIESMISMTWEYMSLASAEIRSMSTQPSPPETGSRFLCYRMKAAGPVRHTRRAKDRTTLWPAVIPMLSAPTAGLWRCIRTWLRAAKLGLS